MNAQRWPKMKTRWMTETFPSGVHTRPEGAGESQTILMLWEYQTKVDGTRLAAQPG
jgi:hypothetical protein